MAYVSGTANDVASLLTALRNFLTANGWTLSGNVLHKGDCHAEVLNTDYPVTGVTGNPHLRLHVGNGIDGSNALTDAAPRPSWLGFLGASSAIDAWSFPITYHIHAHASPDEVWLGVNYNGMLANCWQWMGFGQSPDLGNEGTGCWQFAPLSDPILRTVLGHMPQYNQQRSHLNGSSWSGNNALFAALPFWITSTGLYMPSNSYVHGVIDPTTGQPGWSADMFRFLDPSGYENSVSAFTPIQPLLEYGLNTWNLESPLLRIRLMQRQPEAKTSLISTLQHARMCRNDYLSDGEVVTLGDDRWKVYSFYRKDVAQRNGSSIISTNMTHSGTFALALRYDGP